MPTAPEPSATSLTPESSATPNQSDTTDQPGTSQVVTAPGTLDPMYDESGSMPAQPQAPGQRDVTPGDQLDTSRADLHPSGVPTDCDIPQPPIATTVPLLPDVGHDQTVPIPGAAPPHLTHEPPRAASSLVRPQAPAPNHGTISRTNSSPPPNLLVNITDEAQWMKKKRTLAYFRDTFKLGDLSSVIGHWYELEKLLGFPRVVSSFGVTCLQYAHST